MHMLDVQRLLDEALTIPADKAGPVELKLRAALEKRKDCKHEDVIVKCCRSDEKSGKADAKQLAQTYIVGLGNIIDLLKVYDKCKDEYIQQKLDKKVKLERADGKVAELDPVKDLNKISRLPALKQFIENFEKLVANDTSISSSFKKYAIDDHDRKCIRLMCWNSKVMVWGTREFEPSQKFAVQLWQNVETIDSGSAYGDPDEQCPYCTHSRNHWDNHADDDPEYEQYWYLKIPEGVSCTKRGDLSTPEVVKAYNALKGLGPEILVCQHDSNDDWCDREDNPISEYDIDIHDANETIYVTDDGEVVDPDDLDPNDTDGSIDDLEEIDFNFGPGKEDFYDDVVEIYDKWFSSKKADTMVLKQPWETERQYNERKETAASFVKFIGDHEASAKDNKRFDFEHDVWTHPITLRAEHFKDGILAIQVPQVLNCQFKVEEAEIASLAGFPRDLVGHGMLKEIQFTRCKLKSAGGWSPSDETKSGLRLVLSRCTVESTFQLGDALGGASLQKLAITGGTGGGSTSSIEDFKFLGGASKLKSISELAVTSTSIVGSFEGLSESLEQKKIQSIEIAVRSYYSDSIQINSFRGLPNEVENLAISGFKTTAEAAKDINEAFPRVKSKLMLSIKNTEQDVLIPVFRAVWTKTDETCQLWYNEAGKHVFDTLNIEPITRALSNDKTPSRFKGLQKKHFAKQDITLDLSPRNMYEERSFLSSDAGFSGSAGFDPSKIPLFQNVSKIFCLNDGDYLSHGTYAMVQDGRIVCFSPRMDIIPGPFTKESSSSNRWTNICLDRGEHGPNFSLDEALKVFLATRKSDFPETSALTLSKGFTGKTLTGIDEPDLTVVLARDGCPNLVEVSRCKLAALQDERGRTLHWNDKKTFISQTVFKDCVFSTPKDKTSSCQIEAKAMHNCEVHAKKAESRSTETIIINALEGVFSCKFLTDGGVRISSPQIDNCIIQTKRHVEFNSIKTLDGTSVESGDTQISISPECKTLGNLKMLKVDGSRLTIRPMLNSSVADPESIAKTLMSVVKDSKIGIVDITRLGGMKSLEFLECIQPSSEIRGVELDITKLESFRFKLKKPGIVHSLGTTSGYTIASKLQPNASLDGFDASTALSLGWLTKKDMEEGCKVVKQFAKYFTKHPSGNQGSIGYSMLADPNYIDDNGQFAAPKTLDECLFGRPTSTEKDQWLRVIDLIS